MTNDEFPPAAREPEQEETASPFRIPASHAQVLLEHLPGAVAMLDSEMRYITANSAWIEEMGLTGVTLVGRSHFDVFPKSHESWKSICRSCLSGDSVSESIETREHGVRTYWEVRLWRAEGDARGIVIWKSRAPTASAQEKSPPPAAAEFPESTEEDGFLAPFEEPRFTSLAALTAELAEPPKAYETSPLIPESGDPAEESTAGLPGAEEGIGPAEKDGDA